MLALRANHVVSRSELIDGMWGQDPPASAVNSVHVYVSGLRQVLEPRRARRAPGQVLSATGPGYLLRLEPGQLDTEALDRHLGRARQVAAAGDRPAAARSLDAALDLWQGVPLSGVPGPWADIERVRLDELRLTAVEDRIEMMLALGEHGQAVARLTGLIRQYPLRERFRGQLMVALYRCGRQADALAEFASARRFLSQELGIEPGPELRRLHQQILTSDHALDRPAGVQVAAGPGAAAKSCTSAGPGAAGEPGTAAGPGSAAGDGTGMAAGAGRAGPVPRELPADVTAFTGRVAELAELDRLLTARAGDAGRSAPASAGPAAIAIFAIAGGAGVGKTALTVRWAHQVRDAFPDGQLYVNLRGYDPAEPVAAADALAGFLRALGTASQDIPADVDERAARYRSMLDGRRTLIVLDNAGSIEQVRPLLPGTSSCAVVVTSRDSLAGLVARHGARRLDLDLLPLDDAVALLRALIGGRVDADPAAAATLAEQCARLPLALRVAAEFAATRPALDVAQLVVQLTGERHRLDLLEAGGDPRTAVRTVFSWSYRQLPAGAARAFRLIGLHPGPDLDAYAVAALTGGTLTEADDVLSLLARGHLVHPARPGRYGMHDLLRSYAAHLTAGQDTAAYLTAGQHSAARQAAGPGNGAGEGQVALTRLYDYYLAAAAVAMDTLVPAERGRRPCLPPPATPVPELASSAAARAWLDAERPILLTMAAHAAARGWPGHATRLSAIVCRYLETGGHYTDAVAIHRHARHAARRAGDRHAEAHALNNLGIVDGRLGRYPQAAGHLRQALALFCEAGDLSGAARALSNLGSGDWRQGRYQRATAHHRQALALFRAAGDRLGEARALNGLGLVDWRQGSYPQAGRNFQRAFALYRELGDRSNEAHALANLGSVDWRQGRYQQAAGHLSQALALFREIGDRTGAATALTDLGTVACHQGHYQAAARHHRQALALFREIGERTGEAEALNGLGEVLLATGEPGQAQAQYAAAAVVASQIGDPHEQARAHDGLARSQRAAALCLSPAGGVPPGRSAGLPAR